MRSDLYFFLIFGEIYLQLIAVSDKFEFEFFKKILLYLNKKMKYLKIVIKESIRLDPTLFMIFTFSGFKWADHRIQDLPIIHFLHVGWAYIISYASLKPVFSVFMLNHPRVTLSLKGLPRLILSSNVPQ